MPGVHEYGNDENADDKPAQRILVSDIHVHENFDSRTFRNDIALLKLSEPIQFSGKMNFIAADQDWTDMNSYRFTLCTTSVKIGSFTGHI